jgi:hypothetical protein
MHRITRREDGSWFAEKAIDVPAKKVEGWIAPEMQGTYNSVHSSVSKY